MKTWILSRYEGARRAGVPEGVEEFPASVQAYFNNVAGYEPAEFLRRLVLPTERRVLVVGVGGGRDAYWLALHGHDVLSIDLAYQPDVPRLTMADMSVLPFRDSCFDAVVVADALEHTFDDRQALLEFHRVLREQGALLLNVPFGDDAGEHHVRVYTEATMRRLLESSGFNIERRVYRGVFPLVEQYIPGMRHLFHGVNLAAFILTGRPLYQRLLTAMTDVDWRRGDRAGFRSLVRVHGAYIRARAAAEKRDFRAVNRETYQSQARTLAASGVRGQWTAERP